MAWKSISPCRMWRESVCTWGMVVSVCMFTVVMASRIPLCAINVNWHALCTHMLRGLVTCQSNWLNACVQYVFRGTWWVVPDKMIVCRHNKKHLTLLFRPQPRIYTHVCLSPSVFLSACLSSILFHRMRDTVGSSHSKRVEAVYRSGLKQNKWSASNEINWYKPLFSQRIQTTLFIASNTKLCQKRLLQSILQTDQKLTFIP